MYCIDYKILIYTALHVLHYTTSIVLYTLYCTALYCPRYSTVYIYIYIYIYILYCMTLLCNVQGRHNYCELQIFHYLKKKLQIPVYILLKKQAPVYSISFKDLVCRLEDGLACWLQLTQKSLFLLILLYIQEFYFVYVYFNLSIENLFCGMRILVCEQHVLVGHHKKVMVMLIHSFSITRIKERQYELALVFSRFFCQI